MVTIRDFITRAKLCSIIPLAGNNGLDREISRIGILDWTHVQSGVLVALKLFHVRDFISSNKDLFSGRMID